MARPPQKTDKEASKGVLLVVLIAMGAMVVGAAMHLFWQRYANPQQPKEPDALYLSLGEQAMGIGNHSILIQFTVEYVGRDTEDALRKALPVLKSQVTNRMAQIQTSDLRKLRTPQGKRELADDMRALVQGSLPDKDAENVKGVLYEKFLIGD